MMIVKIRLKVCHMSTIHYIAYKQTSPRSALLTTIFYLNLV